MLKQPSSFPLSRRVTAYHLMFGLVTTLWLALGGVMISRWMLTSRSESARLAELGKASAAIAADHRDHGGSDLQAILLRMSTESGLSYCGFEGPDGRFLAHSRPDQVGQTVCEPTGAVEQWGDVSKVRFVDSNSAIVREYRAPVRFHGRTLGVLHIAEIEPSFFSVALSLAEYAPVTILGPVMVMAIGIVVLQRSVTPFTQIENQLRQVASAPPTADVELATINADSAAVRGWNCLAERYNAGRQKAGLESRIGAAMEGFRQRKADHILNSLPDGVALTDGQRKVTLGNHALAALVGMAADAEELTGRTMEELLGLNPTDTPDNPLLNAELSARTVVCEIRRPGDLAEGVLRVARYPLRAAKGATASGHVWSVRDVTQQKLAEQMRNQFVNSATHELRTPLANIKAYAETLALSDLDVEKQKLFCNTINSEATRLARFIDDLLSISSMEVGSLSLQRQETDVERMLREAVEKVRPQMAQKQIELRTAFPEKLPKLKLDKDKIVATLVNLLGNAAKYTPEGGKVDFKIQVKEENLIIDVEDNGIGISAEELPKVFEKFFRSSDPRVQQQTGSGLGLSLAQEVVRLHGGKLSLHSELNKGSRFTVTLPLS
jgi:PAS domain S-box-containing protein